LPEQACAAAATSELTVEAANRLRPGRQSFSERNRDLGHYVNVTDSGAEKLPIPIERIKLRIHLIRGQKVMFDSDLAGLYQVLTKYLNRAVSRNPDRSRKTSCSGSRLKKPNL